MSKQILYDYALKFVGQPYRWGGDDSINGFDCSGLAIELLQSHGFLPRGWDSTAKGLYQKLLSDGARKVISPTLGTVVFFGNPDITHVGFCLDEILMLEAGGGDHTVVDLETAAKKNAYVRIRPINWRSDRFGFLAPKWGWV